MTVLRSSDEIRHDYDCCVVGAGPVGLAFAMEAAESGLRVLLVDAGNAKSGQHDVDQRGMPLTEIVDGVRHAPVEQIVRRGIGGTSSLWGGRCVAFEPIDFEQRDYIPGGAWPISFGDLSPWFDAAARLLDCGEGRFRAESPVWSGLSGIETTQLERWSRQPKLAPRLGAQVLAHSDISVLTDAVLTDVEFDAGGSVSSVVVEKEGALLRLAARDYVLAMGGLEITRLLLGLQRANPCAFGGVDGPLGRYYMGHATGSIAQIVLTDPESAAAFDFERDRRDTYIRRRITLSGQAQRCHRVLNTSFYLDNPPFYEYRHRSPTLSLVFIGLALPPIGRRLLAEAIRLRHIGPPPFRIGAHIANVLRRPWRAATDVAGILRHRYLSAVRKPGFVLRTEEGRYALHYHAEQLPNPDSRMTMRSGGTGAPVLTIDYRYLEADFDSLLRCHQLLDEQLRSSKIGLLEYVSADPGELRASAWAQAIDGFHSIGTTRMSVDPADGVVDRDCRVHGTSNLYIASSSVFRTAGEANPTFMTACLAVRLAHHLAEKR